VGKSNFHSFVIARRDLNENDGDLFAAVHEIDSGTTPSDCAITQLPLTPKPNERDYQAMAFAVERGNRSDLFLSAIRSDIQYTANYRKGKMVFQGAFGHVQLLNGKFQSLKLVGGTQLRYDIHEVKLEKSMMVGAVHRVNSPSSEITVQFPYRFPTGTAWSGNLLMIMASESSPVLFQSLMVKQVEGEIADSGAPLQTAGILHYPNLIDPPPSLAAPVRSGDQILHETVVALSVHGEGRYSIFYTAPVTVLVDGAGENHRVVLRTGTLLNRIRGKAVAGAITFHLDPLESFDGCVEFMRIP
jgi:hypothetical protein